MFSHKNKVEFRIQVFRAVLLHLQRMIKNGYIKLYKLRQTFPHY